MHHTLEVPEQRLEAFKRSAAQLAAGSLSDDDFKTLRLGVGGHRQKGGSGYMLRVRIPGGRIQRKQWLALADVAAAHSASQRVHVTLRQDVQMYDLGLGGLEKAVEELRCAGMSTYASGGSTVRNVTCGVLADLEPGLPFDPYPYAAALSARLSRGPYFDSLPRKFKIGFAGPAAEKAQAWLNDLAFIAKEEQGRRGFKALVGGGLGASPQNALVLSEFLPAEELGPLTEATLDYFREASPKDQPLMNRFKIILRQRGLDTVLAEVLRRREGRPVDAPVDALEGPGQGAALWIETPQGELSPGQMRALAAELGVLGVETLRLSFDQRIVAPGIPVERVDALLRSFRDIGLVASVGPRPARVVVCAGPETCNRGLVHSRELARALASTRVALPSELHISGCQNGCSQHLISPLGLQGTVLNSPSGRIPAYVLKVGAGADEHGLRFGPALATIPARRVPAALTALMEAWNLAKEEQPRFDHWLQTLGKSGVSAVLDGVPADSSAERVDWGTDQPFEVLLGGSECH